MNIHKLYYFFLLFTAILFSAYFIYLVLEILKIVSCFNSLYDKPPLELL